MWKADSTLIQVELGSGVVKAFTSKDSRSLFDKLLRESLPSEGDLTRTYTNQFREYLQKNEGLTLPAMLYRDNPDLEFNEIQVYFGLETERFKVQDISEMFNFIAGKIRSYTLLVQSKPSDVNDWLMDAIDNVKSGNYQNALRIYSLVYYASYLANDSFQMIRCLSDVGGIILENGDMDTSYALFSNASQLCTNPSVVDPIIKIQVAINIASTLKIRGTLDKSLLSYKTAAKLALSSSNSSLLFIALVGQAEMEFTIGNYEDAIATLEQADSLLFSDETNPNYKTSRNIHKSISEIKSVVISILGQKLQQLQKQVAEDNAKVYFTAAFKEIGLIVAKQGIQYFSCKIFGIKEGAVGMSLIGMFSIKNSTFTQSQIGCGDSVMNLSKGSVNQ